MKYKILIVEDDPVQSQATDKYLKSAGYETVIAECGEDALDKLSDNNKDGISLVFLEMVLPTMDGEEVLFNIQNAYPNLPVIMTTATDNYNLVIDLMNKGVDDFISKPISFPRLKTIIDSTIQKKVVSQELSKIKKFSNKDIDFSEIIAHSENFKEAMSLAKKAAKSNIPILLTGETGTGKDMIAKAIHNAGARAEKPFVVVNCGAINKNMAELILFGKAQGVADEETGSETGKLREADGGTIFFDEISELPHETQVKLLHSIEKCSVEPLGSSKEIKVDIRVISSSSRDMQEEVLSGNLIGDLMFKVSAFPIFIPSLRERKDDIEPLVRMFMQKYSILECKESISIDEKDFDKLNSYEWPGNIRELENVIYRAMLLTDNGTSLKISDDAFFSSKLLSAQNAGKNETYNITADILKLSKTDGTLKDIKELKAEIIEKYSVFFDGKKSEAAAYLENGETASKEKKKAS